MLEMCFIELTFNVCCSLELLEVPEPVVPPVVPLEFELLDEVVPLTSIVWPT